MKSKVKKETRNQKRKREYKAMSEATRGDGSRRAAKRKALKASRAVRLVGTKGAHATCGNPACWKCYQDFNVDITTAP